MADTPAPLSADSLQDRVKAFNESFLRCPVKGCYENEHMRFIDYDVLGDHIQYCHIAAALQSERQRIADKIYRDIQVNGHITADEFKEQYLNES